MATSTAQARLYAIAVQNANRQYGERGLAALGPVLRRAVIMAEVAYIIASWDNAENPAVKLATYAAQQQVDGTDGQ